MTLKNILYTTTKCQVASLVIELDIIKIQNNRDYKTHNNLFYGCL